MRVVVLIAALTLVSCNTIVTPLEWEYQYWDDECIHLDKTMIWYDTETMRCNVCEGRIPPRYRERRR